MSEVMLKNMIERRKKEKMAKVVTAEAARLRMADLCAGGEQCESDIMAKLLKMGLPQGEAREIVSELVERGFIDNRRYAAALAHDQVRFSGWGRRKIAAKLLSKRIESSVIREVLGDLDEEEYLDAAMRVARAKARSLDPGLYEDRIRLLRHLASRGFEADVASKVVNVLKRQTDEDVEGA